MGRQIVLDTETTGIDFKSGHRVIEIGCIEIINRRFTGAEYQTYLNPDREIDEGAVKVHGITLDFLKDKPRFVDVAKEFLEFIKDSELLIHNAEFDVGFLNNELKLLPEKSSLLENVTEKITDTLKIAREKHPGQRNSLDAVFHPLDFQFSIHSVMPCTTYLLSVVRTTREFSGKYSKALIAAVNSIMLLVVSFSPP